MVEVHTYNSAYSQEIIDLVLSIQQGEFNVPIGINDQPDLKDVSGVYQKRKGNFWVAIYDGKVVGTVGLIDIGNKEVALRKMFVDKDFRGTEHGTASKLLQQVLSWINKEKISSIYLGTRTEFHAAHRFYEKNGFVEIAVQDLPANFPRMPHDNVFYKYKSPLHKYLF